MADPPLVKTRWRMRLWARNLQDVCVIYLLNKKGFQNPKVMFGNSFCFLFSKLVFGNKKRKQFSCIFEIKNIFG